MGDAVSDDGFAIGVYGRTADRDGYAVYGYATNTGSGASVGVRGVSASNNEGIGVFGRTTSSVGLTYGVRGEVASPDGYAAYFEGPLGSANYFQRQVGIGRFPGPNQLEVAGAASKATAGEWLANSDARIKQDVETVTSALDTLNRVRLVSFRYTGDYLAKNDEIEDRRYLNVIAQEFAEVFPEHVQSSGQKLPDGSDILQVDTHPLTIYSAAAIQELSRKLEQKETEITDLKTRLANLEQLVNHKLNGGAQ